MKNVAFFSNPILLIGICLMLLFCTHSNNDRLPDPKIQAGIAKVAGKVTNFELKKGEEAPILILAVPNPVTAEMGIFKTPLSEMVVFILKFRLNVIKLLAPLVQKYLMIMLSVSV